MKKFLTFISLLFVFAPVYGEITSILSLPGGDHGEVQVNENFSFRGYDDFTYSSSTMKLTVTSHVATGFIQASTGTFRRITWADGTVQVSSPPAETGDISGVTAGYGIVGGGTSGDVTINLANNVTSYSQIDPISQQPGAVSVHSASYTVISSTFINVGSSMTVNGTLVVDTDAIVNAQSVCLEDGTNCPAATGDNLGNHVATKTITAGFGIFASTFVVSEATGTTIQFTTGTIGSFTATSGTFSVVAITSGTISQFSFSGATGTTLNVNRISTQSTSSGVAIRGTGTNDLAIIGDVGESSSTALAAARNVAPTTQFTSLSTVTLTAGDWILSGMCYFSGAAGTQVACAISANANNTTTDHVVGQNAAFGPPSVATYDTSIAIPPWRISINTATAYYIKSRTDFASGTPTTRGSMLAIRIR